ncbi:hypothetical protein HZH66_000908 [Vespula vulgaris]|uniref:Uncharacterized protein n=1 Tax=Vespula vulgaris TaxID=7454 RepID=A0A834KSB6_VESVU|nr:hypothetical protein HZH66_000908 [Vespula vulgaris]
MFKEDTISGTGKGNAQRKKNWMLKDFEGILNRLISDARDLNPILLWAISMPELYIEAVRRQTEEEIFLETLSILDLVLLDDVKLPTYVEEKENFTIDLTFVNSGLKMPKSDIKETSAGFRGKATTPMSQRKKHTPGLASEVQG